MSELCARFRRRALITAIAVLVIVTSGVTLSKPQTSPNVKLIISGVTETLEKQIRAYLADSQLDDIDNLLVYQEELKARINLSLQAVGFYHPTVEFQTSYPINSTQIKVEITTGKPVRVRALDIKLNGPASTNSEFLKLVANMPLKQGNIFNHQRYEQIKSILVTSARNLGYFAAKFTRSQVLVTKQERHADIYLTFESGDRYHISTVNYKSDLFTTDFLARWQPFEGIVPYRASHVSKLTKNLQNSGYFKYVRVTPQLDKTQDNQVPLLVELESSSENIISLGAGYATDSGPRVKGNWLRPHHNTHGHILEAKTSVSHVRQQLEVGYRVPHNRNPETGSYALDLGLLNHRTEDTFSQLRTLDVSDHRALKKDWHRDLFLRWENERFKVGDKKKRINLLLPGIGFSRTRSSGGLYPKHGDFLAFKLLAGNRKLLSDIDLIRATVSAKHLRSWNAKHFLISRVELGGLHSNRYDKVPTSHRFFAGGDASVRGFAYQSISPVNTNNERIGGRYLTTASLEYNYTLREQWAIAAFVDIGRAYTKPSDHYRVGIGVGLRWLSPVGPLRVDVGYGISEENRPVRLHLSIGPQL